MTFSAQYFLRVKPSLFHIMSVCALIWIIHVSATTAMWPHFVQQFPKTSKFEQYGCPYANDKYEIESSSNKYPVWGTQVNSLYLANKKEFEQLLAKLQQLLGDFLESTLFNNIDDFIEFQQKYLKTKLTTQKFYAQYKPTYISEETLAFQGIGLMNYIVANTKSSYPNISEHLYSVSVDAYPPRSVIKSIKEGRRLPRKKDMYPVMACLKFFIDSTTTRGHILFDPAFDMPHPVVVTDDNDCPSTGQTKYGTKIVQCTSLEYNENYILCRRNTIISNGKEEKSSMLIYTGQAYCSVINFSQKPSLTGRIRSISKRNRDGNREACVHFIAEFRMGKNRQGDFTNMAPLDIFVSSPNMWKTIEFGNLEHLTDEEKEAINIANDKLSLKPGKLLAKLQDVNKIMQDRNVENIASNILANLELNERKVIKREIKDFNDLPIFVQHKI